MLEKLKRWIPILINFAKQHRLVISIVILTFVLLASLFNALPVISLNNVKLVNLDASVRIEPGQTVKLKTSDVAVKISNFTNDICPEGKECFSSSRLFQSVEYKLTIDGKKYATGSTLQLFGLDYKIETISSDYKTFADIKIVKTK